MICIFDSLLSAHHRTHASLNTLTDGLIDLIGLDLDLERPSDDHNTTHQAHRTYAPPPPPTFNTNSPRWVLSLCQSGTTFYEKVPDSLFVICMHALATSFLASGVPQALRRRLASIGIFSFPDFFCLGLVTSSPSVSEPFCLFPFFSLFLFWFAFAQRPQKIPPGEKKRTPNHIPYQVME